jgi:hypothetical protein
LRRTGETIADQIGTEKVANDKPRLMSVFWKALFKPKYIEAKEVSESE